ncbi:MAG: aspartate aminotransferase family protein [Candidatus Hydrogenedentes bacterium]|nr:aspartate aminotransferase family protein [Candidatus Hydrogenedentota bacterium]
MVIEDYRDYVSPGKVRVYRRYGMTLVPDDRHGVYFHDLDGRRFMNFHCNGGVFNLGHRPEETAKALRDAMATMDIGSWCAHNAIRERFAEALAATMPAPLPRVLLCVSASDAVDASIRLAMIHTQRSKVVSAHGAYHGSSAYAIAAGDARFRDPVHGKLPGFVQVPFGDAAAMEREIDAHTAAVILETMPASFGMLIPPDDYFARIRAACDKHGAVLIIDETQTGLGRTGKLWAIKHWGVAPDALITGKGTSGGYYPIAAACFSERFDPTLDSGFFHYTESAGSDLGCSVALRVLEITNTPAFLDRVNEVADFYAQTLRELVTQFPRYLHSFRQKGLFMALVFHDEATSMSALKSLFDHGIYTVYAANDKRAIQFLPPLTITDDERVRGMRILHDALIAMRRLKYRAIRAILRVAVPRTV